MKFLSVGEMVVDFLPGDGEGVYIRRAGGAPANVAIAIARHGCEAGFCGMMGDDDFGHFLLRTLKDNHVEPLVTQLTDMATTTMAFVTLNTNGDRSFTFARKPGADMFLSKQNIDHPWFWEADIVHAGSCSLSKGAAKETTIYALTESRLSGKLVSFDMNYRDLLWDGDGKAAVRAVMDILPYVDLLKVSEEEAAMLGGEDALPHLAHESGISVMVETLGGRGCRCFWNGKVLELPALRTRCVDATGAGDAFWGGFLATLMKAGVHSPTDLTEGLLYSALYCGNIAGWLCVQKKGAIESLPTEAEVHRYMKEYDQ
ncbi:carbohydrate kinase family protein [Caproiciproducens sp. R2]|uniref:carbohydrate kinase family protein n=1 Tax=Caproiciproducens sp. R2 TaxID=3435187 RepID=UPI0040334FC6